MLLYFVHVEQFNYTAFVIETKYNWNYPIKDLKTVKKNNDNAYDFLSVGEN